MMKIYAGVLLREQNQGQRSCDAQTYANSSEDSTSFVWSEKFCREE